MPNKPSSPWFREIHGTGGQVVTSVQCNLCTKIFAKRLERQLSHLGYEAVPGKRNSGVVLCAKLTTRIQALFRRCGGQFPPHNGEMLSEHCLLSASDVPYAPEHSTPKSTGGDSCVGSSQATPLISASLSVGGTPTFSNPIEQVRIVGPLSRSMKQSVIEDGFSEVERRDLDKLWAKFFYEANVPFAVARNEAFKNAVMKTAAFRKPYVPPSYHDVRTRLLKEVRTDLEGKLDSRLSESLRKFGGTLAMDGWSSVTNRPLCNAMLVTPAGELFLGAVDTTGHEKTALYLSSIMLKFIDQVGPENIVQVCTDNASSMLNASRLVVEKYPHIYIQGCATHAMDLLLEDWGKARWIKNTLDKAKRLVKFIKNRQMPLALFRKHEAKLSLLMPGQTRFACNFIMIDRLLKVRESLEQVVVDPEWVAYTSKKSATARDKLLIIRSVRRVVLNNDFWKHCTNFRDMVAPVVYALRDFDAKQPCMGKALHIIRDLEKHVLALPTEPFCLPTDLADTAKDEFYARKRMMSTDLHCAGALLNPYLLHDKELADDPDIRAACKRVLGTLCSPETYPDVANEFMAFRLRDAPFHDMLDPKNLKCSPHAWWEFEGACGKLLAPIAKRILAQTVSSSACERNWSSYSFVHDKIRNRLLPERADDLVFVYTNSKLLANAKLTDEKRWYAENLDLEDPQVHEMDEAEFSNDSIDGATANYDFDDLHDDINSRPALSLEDALNVPNTAYDFVDDDVSDEDPEDMLPTSPFMKEDGMDNVDNILPQGPPLIREDIVILEEKTTGCDTNGGTLSRVPVTKNMASGPNDQAASHGGASRSLFQTSVIGVTTTMEKSSQGLVSLSKQVRPRTFGTKSGGISSDSDVPLGKLFAKLEELPTGSRLQPKQRTSVKDGKRKAPMLPFVPLKRRNPLDAFENATKFVTIKTSTTKSRIKQEVTSDREDDPTGTSGAEVDGDSDWELPTDINE